MANVDAVLASLKQERDKLNQAIAALASIGGHPRPSRTKARKVAKRTMSAAGRARIAAAQRKRWALVRAKKKH